ncbi:acyltransferase family protein [Henriciella sp.]|uniref:acyltransferase family protein n=1 Tax=Henriciella sp. TaxID=1968823 RepID=UPI000C0CBA23|nr:acyltransferase family protein [Henriciella sp.]PHR81064.1 MAG: acyltransferase [Henriciella sp.]
MDTVTQTEETARQTGTSHAQSPTRFRSDIQGLRAVAVLLVLVFHVFPSALPGGYVGVDVFFVISGFLISGLLVKEQERDGRINLLKFYERRIRRLLPAATLVLVAGAAGSAVFLPQLRWMETAQQLLASALYVENWYLYFQSVDYLRADAAPSPFQHYWSLSIEEQFYFVWPLLIMAGAFIAGAAGRKGERARPVWVLIFLAVFAGSLAASILVTERSQPSAYFMTHTRVWELALGALAALVSPWVRMPMALRVLLSWGGLAAICGSAYLYTEESPFPGYIALLPTMGTTVLLLAGIVPGRFTAHGLLSLRPVQYIGDISYSLYLWHWPIVIFALAFVGRSFTLLEGLGIILIALALSAFSKRYVEDTLRHRASVWRAYLLMAGLLAVAALAAAALYIPAKQQADRAASFQVEDTDYPGAAALVYGAETPTPEGPPFIPELVIARKSLPAIYELGCHVARPDVTLNPCTFDPPSTDPDADFSVVIVGDSHAAHWLPAFREIANRRGWTLVTHTKSSCPFVDELLIVAQTEYPECRTWVEAVRADILEREPDLVFTAMVTNHVAVGARGQPANQQQLSEGLLRAWGPLLDAGIPVVAMRGTPRMGKQIPECLGENPGAPEACAISRSEAMDHGGAVSIAAAAAGENVTLLDLTDAFCEEETCHPIVGNIVVYRDENHITLAYMKTLAPVLDEALQDALKKR